MDFSRLKRKFLELLKHLTLDLEILRLGQGFLMLNSHGTVNTIVNSCHQPNLLDPFCSNEFLRLNRKQKRFLIDHMEII